MKTQITKVMVAMVLLASGFLAKANEGNREISLNTENSKSVILKMNNLKEGTEVTVLEDVVTTAGSAIKAINKLRENNLLVKEVLSIVDRREGGYEALKEQNIQLKSLFSIEDFL